MVTAESVKAKLQGLIATANAATGNADADLTAAVGALVAGFGQGGGNEIFKETGKITTTVSYSNMAELRPFLDSIGETGSCVYLRPDWAEVVNVTDAIWGWVYIAGALRGAFRWRSGSLNVPNAGGSTSVTVTIPAGTVFVRLEVSA